MVPTNTSTIFQQFLAKSLHYLQTLAFLPNLLNINAPWSVLDIQTVANHCGIHMECFSILDLSLRKL